jgi:hypothetical protein
MSKIKIKIKIIIIIIGRFVKDGLPPLAQRDMMSSSPGHVDQKRTLAEAKKHTFCALADLDLDVAKSSTSWTEHLADDEAAFAWGSERDLEHYVIASLRDLIALAKLNRVLKATSNHYLWLVGFPDAAVVAMRGHQPRGVVEVKVPAKVRRWWPNHLAGRGSSVGGGGNGNAASFD